MNAYFNIFSVIDGKEGTIRACGYKLPETCSIQEIIEGTTVTVCNCDTDNCNIDHQCDCNNVDPPTPTGLTCQVCGGENGKCQDANDNGESMTCPTNAGEQVCLYIEDCK